MRNFLVLTIVVCMLLSGVGHCQTVTGLYSFTEALSNYGGSILTQGRDGRLYGTTTGFSSTQTPDGTVFKVNTNGSGIDPFFTFNGSDGQEPFSVTLSTDGNYYGTTPEGGTSNLGVLYKVTPTGVFTPLYQFTGGTDGEFPASSPIQASDGNFYGTTVIGANSAGTVYRYVPSTGVLATIFSFDPSGSQGSEPSQLTQTEDGSLYGIAQAGGSNNCGTIFRLSTTGVLLSTYSFPCGSGGNNPATPLLQASDGNLYGTTLIGGNTHASGCKTNGCGTIFKISHGIVSILYRFSGYPNDGDFPTTGLVQGTDGNLYGGTEQGGADKVGALYQVSTSGQYKLLYSFVPSVGSGPISLVQHTNGKFYGIAGFDGQNGYGSIYSLDMGLGPFIALVRCTGRIGQAVQVLGQGLTGSTAVTINGLAATSFKVVTDRYMTAVIPSGATTGPVVVTTPKGAFTSNRNLQIVQ